MVNQGWVYQALFPPPSHKSQEARLLHQLLTLHFQGLVAPTLIWWNPGMAGSLSWLQCSQMNPVHHWMRAQESHPLLSCWSAPGGGGGNEVGLKDPPSPNIIHPLPWNVVSQTIKTQAAGEQIILPLSFLTHHRICILIHHPSSPPSLPPPPFFPVSSVCILATPDSEVVLYRLVPLSHK